MGMITALGLAQAGLSVRIIERQPRFSDAPRAAVYHWSVLDGFARMNILDDLERIALRCANYTYLLRKTGERISYSLNALRNDTIRPYNLHLGQHHLVDVIARKLSGFASAAIALDTKLVGLTQDADGVTINTESASGNQELRTSWLIGADGASSTVRRLLGLSFDGITWPERFIATNLRFNFEKYGYSNATFVVDPLVGAVIVPLNHGGLWRCTYMEDCDLPENGFVDRLPQLFRQLLPGDDPYIVEQASPYRMHQRSAPRYRVGRVLLAGDAAHSTNPTGGLGLTSGLFDSYALQEALRAVVLEGFHDSVLTRYSNARRITFVDYVSPQAVANKNFVFHANAGGTKWEETLVNLRRMNVDDDYARQRLLFTKTLESPSLLAGSPTA